MKLRLIQAAIVVAVVGAFGFLMPGAAHAETEGYYNTNGVNIRTCAWASCTSVGHGQLLQRFRGDCWVDGQSVGGTTVWVRGLNRATGAYGYSAAVYLQSSGNGTPGSGARWRYYVPPC